MFSNNNAYFGIANSACTNFGAHLAEINSLIERNALVALNYGNSYWVGYYDSYCDWAGTYAWNLISGASANLAFLDPWLSGYPGTSCPQYYLVWKPNFYIINTINSVSVNYNYLCEMIF